MATYKELTRSFPLRPIKRHDEFAAACKKIESLKGKENLNSDESDYIEVLETLAERYCQSHYAHLGIRPELSIVFK